ncbi:MAG TPA: EVE domain-containing protein [Legionellales bacterium]|jgi:predicted RNA-binding protein with PUA-like domain|nr:EVE domain-containing protein [Legionellales bacterium]
MQYWLMKSEPEAFSIDDLMHAKEMTTTWDGVRNYQARNFMKQMKLGDLVFFYHSNCKVPGIIGIAKVCREAYPDFTAQDPQDIHYDPKSTPEKPIWEMVNVQFVKKFKEVLPLQQLYQHPELQEMPLIRKGNRLSVMPVTDNQWNFILQHVST